MPEHNNIYDEPEYESWKDKITMTVDDLKGKTILSVNNGEKIGQVDDILIDPDTLHVSGVIVKQGTMFDRETVIIPAADIQKWGKDAVLVRDAGVFRKEIDLPERENWMSATEKFNKLSIVSTNGENVGQVQDVLIGEDGKIVAYRVSSSSGPFGDTREVSAYRTQKVGKDVVIIDMDDKFRDIPR